MSSIHRAAIERICRENGISLTSQRRAVLLILPTLNHPTVDDMWEEIRKSLPGISRTTVYRILEHFASLRIIRKVCHPSAVVRYEDRTDRHHHLLCTVCGCMSDFDNPTFDQMAIPGEESGFLIEDYSIQFRGLCRACAEKGCIRNRTRTQLP